MARVKLDEDLSPIVGEPLRQRGHDVLTVSGQGWGGLGDMDLWKRVLAEDITFVTADKGFSDVRTYPPGTHAGIILLRPDRESAMAFQSLVRRLVDRHHLDDLRGAVFVVTPRQIRIRRG